MANEKFLNNSGLSHYDTKIKDYIDTEVAKKGDVKFTGTTAGATLDVDLRKDNNNYVNLQRSYSSGIEQLTLKARGDSTAMTTMKFYTADTVDSKINQKPWGIDVFNNSSTENKTAIHLTSNPVQGQVGSNYAWFTETDNGMKVQASQMQDKELSSIDYVDTQTGDLTQLTTSSKTDLVGAVNEVFSSIPNIDDNLNTNSGNPVQNKVITTRLNSMNTAINGKQATLVSGTNIKTFEGESILGSGNIKLPHIVGSNWGVAKTGSGSMANNSKTTTISISDLGLSSVNDYQVQITFTSTNVNNDTVVYVTKTSATQFTVGRYNQSNQLDFNYTVFAKGFGSIPKGGSTGQVLAKKSSADGDVEWITGGGGGGTGNVDQTYDPTSVNAQSGTAVAQAIAGVQSNLDDTNDTIGDLTSLTTTTKTDIVSAINDVDFAVKNIGEPFRVVNWASNDLNVNIVPCTTDIGNTQLDKMIFSIDNETGAEYQIVGMIAYEVFDAASGGNRINCWPVCQFTGNGQKELSVRWMCGGTTNKTAKRIAAWVLLKHR